MRIFDENAMPPPAALAGKTLHVRTKSVPSFSTVQIGAAKAAAVAAGALPGAVAGNKKVLGEVNTNLKLAQSAKDDSVLGKKAVNVNLVKPSAPLARPASRPSTAKSFSTLSVPNTLPLKEQIPLPAVPLQEPARKLVVKKSTKVLKDVETVQAAVPAGQSVLTSEARANEPALEAVPIPASVESVLVETAQSQDVPVRNNVDIAILPSQTTTTSAQSHIPSNFQSEKEYILHLETQASQLATRLSEVEAERVVQSQAESTFNALQQQSLQPYAMRAPASAQQYYDQEHELDFYEEDDYTTACSIGLRGGSIGGLTTILVPPHTEESCDEIRAGKMYIEDSRPVEEIDDEAWDTSMVAEYSEEIFRYMRTLEDRMLPNPRYMDQQTEIQWSMRAVLVDWVVQVHQRFNLLPETLFLAVNYIDRFLTHKVVSLGKLQLVGATALFIAAKFEEVNCPTLNEVIFMVDGGYTVDELLKAERFMLSMLQFDLGWPGPMSFLRRISKADDYDLETRTLAKYFLEVTLMDERFVGCPPSFLAAGAHCMARLMLCKGDWSMAHVGYAEYTYNELRQLLHGIFECCENPQKHHLSVYEKYTEKRYKRASIFVAGEMAKGFSLHPRAIRNSLANGMGAPIMR